MAVSQDLDENIWAEILKRLPVKVVGQIRCVCKSWNTLISSAFFINHQLSLVNFTASSSNNNPGYLVFDPCVCWSSTVHSCLYNPDEEEPHLAKFSPLPFETDDGDNGVKYNAIGAINGVVCLGRELAWPRTAGSAILWNPTLRKHVATPDDQCEGGWIVVGFGFDARTNDFKVVRFTPPGGSVDSGCSDPLDEPPPRFEVFSTRGGGWRSVAADHISPFLLVTYCLCYKNGFIHWVVERRGGVKGVLVFDCERDEFEIMHLPREVRTCRQIGYLFIRYCCSAGGGMLSLLAEGKGPGAELWVMEEYGVSTSWKKLKPPPPEDFVCIYESGGGFLQLEEDFETNKLGWNLVDRRIHLGLHQPLNAYAFQPSLFLMDNINAAGTLP